MSATPQFINPINHHYPPMVQQEHSRNMAFREATTNSGAIELSTENA